jgi:hypothetical protein
VKRRRPAGSTIGSVERGLQPDTPAVTVVDRAHAVLERWRAKSRSARLSRQCRCPALNDYGRNSPKLSYRGEERFERAAGGYRLQFRRDSQHRHHEWNKFPQMNWKAQRADVATADLLEWPCLE